MKDFREMQVWHKGHKLALEIYKLTAKFPKEEIYGLSSQIRRAAVSIPTNIAEGCGRGSTKELKYFCNRSRGINPIFRSLRGACDEAISHFERLRLPRPFSKASQ